MRVRLAQWLACLRVNPRRIESTLGRTLPPSFEGYPQYSGPEFPINGNPKKLAVLVREHLGVASLRGVSMDPGSDRREADASRSPDLASSPVIRTAQKCWGPCLDPAYRTAAA